MCGRVRLANDYSEIKIRLKFAPDAPAPNYEVDYNKPPTMPMLVAIRSVDGQRIPKMMKWGLIPHWAKDDKLAYSTFNARSEEFTTKPAFKDAWRRGQRCLVVTNGFYEWKKLDPKGKLKASLRRWHGGRQRDGYGRPLVDMAQSGQRRRSPKLHGSDLRTERRDGRNPQPHASHPGRGRLAEMAGRRSRRRGRTTGATPPVPRRMAEDLACRQQSRQCPQHRPGIDTAA